MMISYQLEQLNDSDRLAKEMQRRLLLSEGISEDPHLDYSAGLFDAEGTLIATGSCFKNTLRCLAVSSSHRGEGLLTVLVSHLLSVQAERGNRHVFLYTKPESAAQFADLGFSEITRVNDAVFMETPKNSFETWLSDLSKSVSPGAAAVVMNANPFTLGHRKLLETAASEHGEVLLFLLEEEAGPIPFAVRKKLVEDGIRDLPNVRLIPSGSYLISHATFPSYFLKSEERVIRAHVTLDLAVFRRIAAALDISLRYVGEEPFSRVTRVYNEVMAEALPESGIVCRIIPRYKANGRVISASTVREAIRDGRLEDVRAMLPESTYRYFTSEESEPVIRAIRAEKDVRHY